MRDWVRFCMIYLFLLMIRAGRPPTPLLWWTFEMTSWSARLIIWSKVLLSLSQLSDIKITSASSSSTRVWNSSILLYTLRGLRFITMGKSIACVTLFDLTIVMLFLLQYFGESLWMDAFSVTTYSEASFSVGRLPALLLSALTAFSPSDLGAPLQEDNAKNPEYCQLLGFFY